MTTITTGDPTRAQAEFGREALRSQRARLVAMFRDFDDDSWNAPTLCSEWCVHEVVRHLCDVTLTWITLLRDDSANFDGFDPRTTPLAWLERSAAERPADTLDVFERASAEVLDEVDRRLQTNATDRRPAPYGIVPWSTLVFHVFWDAWVHERDILVPAGRPHESPEIESRAAAMYGLLMSGVPSALFNAPLDETIVLDGTGGGAFHLDVHDGIVTTSTSTSAGSADLLRGVLPDVVDSLIGRGPELPDVLQGPAERVNQLAALRRFILSPVAPVPT